MIKTKLYIILILISLSHFAFGQRGESFNFNFKVKFEEKISIDNLDIYYLGCGSNNFTDINYKFNTSNEVEFSGKNYSIKGAGDYFPILIFSIKENKLINSEEVETRKLFYLISEIDGLEDFDKEIYFKNLPFPYFNKVDLKWNSEEKTFRVEQLPLKQLSSEFFEIITSNSTLIKINPK